MKRWILTHTPLSDILLSDEPPESEYEYVNPTKMVMIEEEADNRANEMHRAGSSSPQSTTSSFDLAMGPGLNASTWRSQRPNAYYVPPRLPPTIVNKLSGCPIVKNKPFMLPKIPSPMSTAPPLALSTRKPLGPPVPPRVRAATVRQPISPPIDSAIHSYIDIMFDEDDDDMDENNNGKTRKVRRSRPIDCPSYRMRRANSADELCTDGLMLTTGPKASRMLSVHPRAAPTGGSGRRLQQRNVYDDTVEMMTPPPPRTVAQRLDSSGLGRTAGWLQEQQSLSASRRGDRAEYDVTAASTTSDKVFDDIGLVPANIASLSVEEVSESVCVDVYGYGYFYISVIESFGYFYLSNQQNAYHTVIRNRICNHNEYQ